jgi:pimeloyl-ACP methyl ester carboxylesterase
MSGKRPRTVQIVDRGQGAPLVFVPGLQGRWEYAEITVNALAEHFRVITTSLCDEPTSGGTFDASKGMDAYADHVAAVMDTAGVRRALVCGLSFGGLVALNAASRWPDRVGALVLASTPGPGFHLRPRHEMYARWPRLFGAAFLAETPFRAAPEIRRAMPSARDRRVLGWSMLRTGLRAPLSLPRMAARARVIGSYDIPAACARVTMPTLVLTGEPGLDFVVTTETTEQYVRLIADAHHVVLDLTGHQGSLTRPAAFADIVRRFAEHTHHAAA